MSDKILNCDRYDYLEIACLYSFVIELTLTNNQQYEGRALTIQIETDSGEVLVFANKHDGNEMKFPLSELKSMRAITENPHFSYIEFW